MESFFAIFIFALVSIYPLLFYIAIFLLSFLVFSQRSFGRKRWWLRGGALLLVAVLPPFLLNYPLNTAIGTIRDSNVPLADSTPLELMRGDIILLDWFDDYRARQTPDHTPCHTLCQNLLYTGDVDAVLLPMAQNEAVSFWRFRVESRAHCDPVINLFGPAAMLNGVGECLTSQVVTEPTATLRYTHERESAEGFDHVGSQIALRTYLTEVVRFDASGETVLFRETSVRANYIITPMLVGMIADLKSGRKELFGRISRSVGRDIPHFGTMAEELFGTAVAEPTAPSNALEVAINALRDPDLEASAAHNLLFHALDAGQRSDPTNPASDTQLIIEAIRDPRVSRVFAGRVPRWGLTDIVLPVQRDHASELTQVAAERMLSNPNDTDNNAALNELLKRMPSEYIATITDELYQMAEQPALMEVAVNILRLTEIDPDRADFFADLLRDVLDSGERPALRSLPNDDIRQATLAIRALCLLGAAAADHDGLLIRYYTDFLGSRPRRRDTLQVGRTLLRMESGIDFREYLTARNMDHGVIFDSIERPPSPERC